MPNKAGPAVPVVDGLRHAGVEVGPGGDELAGEVQAAQPPRRDGVRELADVEGPRADDLVQRWSGRGRPAGGIIPARSLRSTRSQSAASAPTLAVSIACSETGTLPRRSPASLWQVTQ